MLTHARMTGSAEVALPAGHIIVAYYAVSGLEAGDARSHFQNRTHHLVSDRDACLCRVSRGFLKIIISEPQMLQISILISISLSF